MKWKIGIFLLKTFFGLKRIIHLAFVDDMFIFAWVDMDWVLEIKSVKVFWQYKIGSEPRKIIDIYDWL